MSDSKRCARRLRRGGEAFALSIVLLSAPAIAMQAISEGADPVEREAHYRRELLADPESPEAYVGLARALADGGRTEEALSLLTRAGDRWLRIGAYEGAQAVLELAVELRPDDASLLARLGRAQTLNRNHRSAVASLERAVELGRRDAEVYAYLGTALWEVGRLDEAEARYRESLAIERSPLGVYQLGRLLLWQGRYAEAVPLLREVAGVSASADILVDLADAQRGAGDVEGAISTYRRVLARAPGMIKAHYGLATVLRQSGDLAGARGELETVGRLHEESEERTRREQREKGEIDRAREMLRDNRVGEAIAQLESLTASVDALSLLARAYLRNGDPAGAGRALEEAIALDPGNSELRRQLAEARRLAAGGDS